MNRYVLLFLFLAAGSSCSNNSAPFNEVNYACDQDKSLRVRFYPGEEAVLVYGEEAIELQRQRSASGFLYSNGSTSIRGKGDELIVEMERMVALNCQAL